MKELKEVLEWKIHTSCVKKYALINGHALKILKSTSLCLNDKTTPRGKESRKMVTSKILKNIIYQNDFPEKNLKKVGKFNNPLFTKYNL